MHNLEKPRQWRPMKDAEVPELGLLNACLASIGHLEDPDYKKLFSVRYNFEEPRKIEHVCPVVNRMGEVSDRIHVFVKNTWKALKSRAHGKPILLPGRDVFLWEVMARQEDYPTVFSHQVSRITVDQWAKEHPECIGMFAFDTGFMGSVLRPFHRISMSGIFRESDLRGALGSADQTSRYAQVFPRLRGARGIVLQIENLPKYYRRAYIAERVQGSSWGSVVRVPPSESATIQQDPAPLGEIVNAARFTIAFWYKQSPRFLKGGMLSEDELRQKKQFQAHSKLGLGSFWG